MFVGTPSRPSFPTSRSPGKPRLELLAPEGCKNLATDKKVTSSDEFPIIGELELVTDGDKDGADGSFVELGPNKQWVPD